MRRRFRLKFLEQQQAVLKLLTWITAVHKVHVLLLHAVIHLLPWLQLLLFTLHKQLCFHVAVGTKGKRQKPFIRWFRLLRHQQNQFGAAVVAGSATVMCRCGSRGRPSASSLAPRSVSPQQETAASVGANFCCRSFASTEPPWRVRPVLSRLRSRRSPALLPQTSGRESASARRLRRFSRLPERLLRELGPDRTEPRWSYLRVEQPSRRTEPGKPKEPETPGQFLSRAGAGLNTTSGVTAAYRADPPTRHFPRAAPSVIGRREDSMRNFGVSNCGVLRVILA